MPHQAVELNFLYRHQSWNHWAQRRQVCRLRARVHESKWVPLAPRRELRRQFHFTVRLKAAGGLPGEISEAVMFADPPKPVFGGAIVRFAPVHYAVEKTAIGGVDVLGNRVGLIQIIMPEQGRGANGS